MAVSGAGSRVGYLAFYLHFQTAERSAYPTAGQLAKATRQGHVGRHPGGGLGAHQWTIDRRADPSAVERDEHILASTNRYLDLRLVGRGAEVRRAYTRGWLMRG